MKTNKNKYAYEAKSNLGGKELNSRFLSCESRLQARAKAIKALVKYNFEKAYVYILNVNNQDWEILEEIEGPSDTNEKTSIYMRDYEEKVYPSMDENDKPYSLKVTEANDNDFYFYKSGKSLSNIMEVAQKIIRMKEVDKLIIIEKNKRLLTMTK